ncbi:MAG: 2-oxo acid dehydrogenase subunit E2 [Lentisphaeria bacterium]|nr:2-oxo acid dehydrogenase subunit E2 [Lentisphaeria bacterium]
MNVEITMPDVGTTTDEVEITAWLIAVGDEIKRGEPLLEVETDKASVEVESIATGKLLSILIEAGEMVKVGTVIATVESDAPVAKAASKKPTETKAPAKKETVVVAKSSGDRVSFFQRNRDRRNAGDANAIPLSPIQRIVGKRVQESKQTVPHFYLEMSANAESMCELRQASDTKLVWDAFFAKAISQAMQDFPKFSTRLDGDKLIPVNSESVGIAADIDEDLYVVTVTDVLSKSFAEISGDIIDKVTKIKSGDVAARKIEEAAISISNLGACGVDAFAAIVNPPQVAILAIGRIAPTVVIDDEGDFVAQRQVRLTLSVDHRVVSGKYAGNFLAAIKNNLETIKE